MSIGKSKLIHSLYEFQKAPVEDALARKRHILNWDTGLGKTYAAGAVMQEVGGEWLVVCPAGVVRRWQEFLTETAIESESLKVSVVADTQLEKVQIRRLTGIVIDEIHRFKTYNAKRTQQIKLVAAPCEFRLGLTATLIPNDPGDVFEPCSIVYDRPFGSVWQFRETYQNKVPDEHAHSGFKWQGVSEAGGAQLARKLERLVSRVTKADVTHLLTPLRLHVVAEDPPLGENAVVLTHNRDRAHQVGGDMFASFILTGALTAKQRHKMISAWEQTASPLVATMHCVNEGIDLTHAHQVIFDQLFWRPATIIQAIGRFHRLNQKEPVDIYFVVKPNSLEQRIALVLKEKFDAMGRSGNASSTDNVVLSGLSDYMDTSDEDVLKRLMSTAPKEIAQDVSFFLRGLLDSDIDTDDD